MRESWRKLRIEDIITGLYDGPHATPKPSDEGPVFFGIKNLTDDGRLDLSEIRHIAEDDFPRWTKRVLPQKDDIVFTYEATLHRYGLIPEGLRCCLGRRMALIRVDQSKADPKFLLYYFRSSEWRQTMEKNLLIGATVNRIPIGDFPKFPVQLPPLHEQKSISKILNALDSKIELNNRINAELEAMAKTIYDYWFVQFEFPISAALATQMGKPELEGRPYKSSGGEMVWNERIKREVPKGWEVKALSAVLECNKHTRKKGDTYDFINYLDTSSLTENRIASVQRIDPETEKVPSRAQRVVLQNDILYSTVRPNQLHYGIIKDPVENMIASTGFAHLRSKTNGVSNDLIYFFLTSEHLTARLQKIAENSVSAYPSISPNDILSLKISFPKDISLLEPLNSFLDSINRSISKRQIENQELASLRDWLLPMLMNGQVKVGEVKPSRSLSGADKDLEGLGKEYVQEGEMGMAAEEKSEYGRS